MRRLFKAAAASAALAHIVCAQAAAATAAKPCLTRSEIETLVGFVLPPVVEGLARKCSVALPTGAYLRASAPTLAARYRREAPVTWAKVKPVVSKLADMPLPANLDGELGAMLMEGMVASMLLQGVAVKDCNMADRIVEALAPLPVINLARLAEIAAERNADGGSEAEIPFTLCTTGAGGR